MTSYFLFFNDTATTEIYTLSLHDALPIWAGRPTPLEAETDAEWRPVGDRRARHRAPADDPDGALALDDRQGVDPDRKSTRLNSSHANNSYAVFCLKKKKNSSN